MSSMRPHDRRRHPRLPAETLAFLSAQLSAGSRVSLLDVSHGGVRLETPQHVRPGHTLSVSFTIDDEVVTVMATVVRATVTRLTADHVCYETALQLLEGEHREQFQLALASRGRAAHAAGDPAVPTPPGLDVVLIADESPVAPREWWLGGSDASR